MRTEKEIIEAMLDLQHRITVCTIGKTYDEYSNNEYYKRLKAKLSALKFSMGMEDVIA